MKRNITIIIIALFAISCNQASKKEISKANDDFKDGNKSLGMAVKDADSAAKEKTVSDWKLFKLRSDSSLNAIDKDIVTARGKIAKADKKEQLRLKKDLQDANLKLDKLKANLKKENQEFDNEIGILNAGAKSRNESFKREFDHDSRELGKAIGDLFKDNVR